MFRSIAVLLPYTMLPVVWSDAAGAERYYVAADIYSPASRTSAKSTETSSALFAQARRACEQDDVGKALQLSSAVVRIDPNHAAARRVLGYQRIGDRWAGGYAARRLKRDEVWHPEFGWLHRDDVARYEAGERRLGKRQWISMEEDARRHATIDQGWQIRTDHFLVTTDHSLEGAAKLVARLESLYQIWQQLFGGFYLRSTDLLKRFDGKQASGYRRKPFEVNYYRTREEYNSLLIRQQPRIAMTLGIYFDKTRKTHFFDGGQDNQDGQDAGTIYHEAVHQFFHESSPAVRRVGAQSNAWLIEGVACYFESLAEYDDHRGMRYYTIGTPNAGRLPAARHRRLVDDYYVPLAELSALGIDEFQQRSDLPRLYSQSAGLMTFLMHYERGRYRPAVVKLLQLLYTGRDQASTLERLTGRRFAELDREYREYLEQLSTTSAAPP